MKYKIMEVHPGQRYPEKGFLYNRKEDAIYTLEHDFNVGTDGSGFWSTPEGLREFEGSDPGTVNYYAHVVYLIVQDLEPEVNEFGVVTP